MEEEGQATTIPSVENRPSQTSDKFRNMIRQNSVRIGIMAENVVLPMNKRSLKRSEDQHDAIDLESKLPAKSEIVMPVKQFPIFIVGISIIQVLVFIYGEDAWLALCYDPFRRHEIWRYFTEMLVHKSLSHLLGNVIFQLILGVLLEIVHHWKRIGAVYMGGVLGGALAVTILDPQRYSLGASGGVFGLLFAHLATIILNWNQMDRKCCRLFWLLAYITFDVGISVYVSQVLHYDSKVSHAGHFGGALGGFIVAVFVLRNFEKLAWEKKFQKILLGITVVLLLIVLIVNTCFPSYYLPTELNFDYMETFVRYVIRLLYNSPEWKAFEQECFENLDCKTLVEEMLNATKTSKNI